MLYMSLYLFKIQRPTCLQLLLKVLGSNRPFPSSLVPLLQSESKSETMLMKMTLICMRVKLHVEIIFIWKVSYLDSF